MITLTSPEGEKLTYKVTRPRLTMIELALRVLLVPSAVTHPDNGPRWYRYPAVTLLVVLSIAVAIVKL